MVMPQWRERQLFSEMAYIVTNIYMSNTLSIIWHAPHTNMFNVFVLFLYVPAWHSILNSFDINVYNCATSTQNPTQKVNTQR